MKIRYIHEPTDLQCGQAVLAMALNKTVDEIIEYLGNDLRNNFERNENDIQKIWNEDI